MMSTCVKRLAPSIWTWDDPRFPFAGIRAQWVEGAPLSPACLALLRFSYESNPDPRIREECRGLLSAADLNQATSGAATLLRRRATAARLRKMVIKLPEAQ